MAVTGATLTAYAFSLVGTGHVKVMASAFFAQKNTRTPMWVTFTGTLLLRVTTVYVFTAIFGWGLAGVWLGTAVDWAGRSAITYLLFRRGRWKRVQV